MPKITVHGGSEPPRVHVAVEDQPKPDYSDLPYKELQAELRARGLPTGGSRNDLVKRLREA